jgi:hypothetical protein
MLLAWCPALSPHHQSLCAVVVVGSNLFALLLLLCAEMVGSQLFALLLMVVLLLVL